jgi:hypothetical protein
MPDNAKKTPPEAIPWEIRDVPVLQDSPGLSAETRIDYAALIAAGWKPPGSPGIEWIDARLELPDDDITVLMAFADGGVWNGFRDAGEWRFASADLVAVGEITHWADYPEPPSKEGPSDA